MPKLADEEEEYLPSLKYLRITPETYIGSARGKGFGSVMVCTPKGCDQHVDNPPHERDTVYLQGEWSQVKEYIRHSNDEEG